VHVPAQPLLTAPPLRDQVVAVIDEQLQLARRLLAHPRTIEQRLLQRGSRDRERVDPVRRPTYTSASTLRRRQPWRHPHQPLARGEQRSFEGRA
jgi:hypothetical protein